MRRIIVVSGFVILMRALSPDMLSCRDYVSVWREEEALCVERLGPSSPPMYLPLIISVTSACLLRGVGAHGWVVSFCQRSVQSSSWSWL